MQVKRNCLVRIRALPLKFVGALIVCMPLVGNAVTVSRAGTVGADYFDMHIHQPLVKGPWPTIDFASRRLWDSNVAWPQLEPQKDTFDFRNLDVAVTQAEQHKVSVLLTLGLSPAWASARPDETSGYKPGNAAEPQSINDWRNYVRTVASRYKDRISAYEIWNEPNLKQFYSGTPETMAAMTQAACVEIRKAAPHAIIVGPPPTGASYPWYDKFLKASDDHPCFDVVGWHFYTNDSGPEGILTLANGVHALLARHGITNKPIWNTESGYFVENASGPRVKGTLANPTKLVLEPDLANAFVARSLIVGWVAGLDRFYWYAWDNAKLGMIEPDNFQPKPMADAWERTRNLMLGASQFSCEVTTAAWACHAVGRDGKPISFSWSSEALPNAASTGAFTRNESAGPAAAGAQDPGRLAQMPQISVGGGPAASLK